MSKYLTIGGLYLLLIVWSGCESPVYTDHKELHLKGPVKELHFKRYKAQEEGGQIVKKRLYSNTLDRPQKYEYERLPTNCQLYFGRDKNITTLQLLDGADQPKSKIVYRDTIFENYKADGTFMGRVVTNSRQRPTLIRTYNATGVLFNRIEITYDQEGRMDCTHREYNAEGKLAATVLYQYNEAGLLIRVETHSNQDSHYHPKKDVRVEKIKYDEYNHPSEITIDEGGVIDVIKIMRRLDNRNNWVQAIEYLNGKPERFLERELVYYNLF